MSHCTSPTTAVLQAIPGNKTCIDCGGGAPTWASANLGILFCLKCSGVHRSLGVDYSFVRSIAMDDLKYVELTALRRGGNAKLAAFFAAHGVPFSDDIAIPDKYISPVAVL